MPKKPLHIQDLLKSAQNGEKEAIQEIYIIYYDRLIRYGLSMNYEKGLLYDKIQDMFVWILLHPEKLAQIKNLDTYLFKSLKRNLNSSLKREKGKKNSAEKYQIAQKEESNAETRLIESENKENQSSWLITQLSLLSPHQKEVIYLKFYENLTYDEMAEILSVSNQVVRNSVFRALKKLRKNVQQENPRSLKGLLFLFSFFF